MKPLIAITGAAGLVGRALLAEAAGSGLATRALLRPGSDSPRPAGVDCREVEVRDAAALEVALVGCTSVVHAAGRMQGDEEQLRSINRDGTAAVLRAATAAGCAHFVLISSVVVYGSGDLLEIDEQHPVAPSGAYAESKLAAEELARAAAPPLSTRILRPTTIYGPGDRHFTPFLLALARDGVLPLVRGGEVLMDLVAARDVAEAALTAATHTEPGRGRIYHVSPAEALSVRDIAERLRGALGLPARTALVHEPTRPPEGLDPGLVAAVSEHRRFRIDRARTELGYRGARSFPAGLDEES